MKKKQYTTDTQISNRDKKDTRSEKVSVTTSRSYLLDENVRVSLLLYFNRYIYIYMKTINLTSLKSL